MSPLVLGEVLEVFANTFIADDKYPVQDCEILPLAIQMQLFEKKIFFLNFFSISRVYIKSEASWKKKCSS